MKDKCGGGIKENIMCMKVWEKLVEKWEWKILLDVSRKKKKGKNTEKRHMRKKIVKEKKSEKKEKFKSKECVRCGENRSICENEGKMGQKDDICP